MVEGVDGHFGVATATHADTVQAVAFGMVALDRGVGHCIFYNYRIAANKGFEADAAELMDPGICPDTRPIRDLDVARERCSVSHDYLAAQLAIVRYVSLGHQQIAVANPGHSAATLGPPMDGDEFSDVIFLTYLCASWFARVFQILRSEADRDEWEYVRFIADRCSSIDDDMRFQADAVSKFDIFSNSTERANVRIVTDPRSFGNDRSFVLIKSHFCGS